MRAFACHANFKDSILYATLTTEIMMLCSGIVNLTDEPSIPMAACFFHEAGNIAVMLICEAASFC